MSFLLRLFNLGSYIFVVSLMETSTKKQLQE